MALFALLDIDGPELQSIQYLIISSHMTSLGIFIYFKFKHT